MVKTISQLEELAEKERCVGNRQKFLEIQKQIEIKEQEEVLARHKLQLEIATKDFPVDFYIPELHARVKEIKDGCGTQKGWVEIYLSGFEKALSPNDIRRKIQDSKNEKTAREYIDKLNFSDRAKALRIGDAYQDTIDMLIEVMSLDLPSGEEVDEQMMDYTCETYGYVLKQAKEEGYTDKQAEEKAMEGEDKERAEEFSKYQNAIMRTLNYLLNFHDLELEKIGKHYYLIAQKSWKEVANKVAATITGYGMFEYNNGKELRDVGPYKNYCEATIQHLHWLKYYPEVYGETGYRRVYER